MEPNKLQPAILGGLFMGVLSGLPFINLANCCCLWVIGGGVLAAYLMQQNHPAPITVADGAIVGLLAGLIGAMIWTVVSIPMEMMMGPAARRIVERLLEGSQDIPIETRNLIESFAGPAAFVVRFGFTMVVGLIFGTLGGVLGAAVFKTSTPPPGTVEVLPPQ